MDLELSGKTVIVVGGASNIGRETTLGFAKEGANVVIADYDEKQAKKTAADANAIGGKAIAVNVDITKPDEVEAMVKKTLEEFKQIDVLANVAGGMHKPYLFIEAPREEFVYEINLNLWGPINTVYSVLPHMIERRCGSIVLVGSDAGRSGEYKEAVYGAAKAGVSGLAMTVAMEVGPYGIRINVVCPSWTPGKPDEIGDKSCWKGSVLTPDILEKGTKLYPLRKLGKPEDLANAILFLASEKAGHITGQTLSVNGGYFRSI
ncbi:SDR family NAD(P)-dependent oxidoreductase [Chloroflexota bacterium]